MFRMILIDIIYRVISKDMLLLKNISTFQSIIINCPKRNQWKTSPFNNNEHVTKSPYQFIAFFRIKRFNQGTGNVRLQNLLILTGLKHSNSPLRFSCAIFMYLVTFNDVIETVKFERKSRL